MSQLRYIYILQESHLLTWFCYQIQDNT